MVLIEEVTEGVEEVAQPARRANRWSRRLSKETAAGSLQETAASSSAAPPEAMVEAHSQSCSTAHSQRTMPTTVFGKRRHDRNFATTISEEEIRAKYGRGLDIIMGLDGISSTVLCANTRHSNGYGIGYGRNNNRKEEPGSHCEFVAAKKAVEPHEAAQRQEDALKKVTSNYGDQKIQMDFLRSFRWVQTQAQLGAVTLDGLQGEFKKGQKRKIGGRHNSLLCHELDHHVFQFFVDCVDLMKKRCDTVLLMHEARHHKQLLIKYGRDPLTLPKLTGSAGSSWLRRFMKRYNIIKVKVSPRLTAKRRLGFAASE